MYSYQERPYEVVISVFTPIGAEIGRITKRMTCTETEMRTEVAAMIKRNQDNNPDVNLTFVVMVNGKQLDSEYLLTQT